MRKTIPPRLASRHLTCSRLSPFSSLLWVAAAAILLAACSGGNSPLMPPSPTVSTPTVAPSPTVQPSASVAELNAVVEQAFPGTATGAAYVHCGANPTNLDACPYSTRLKSRLRSLTSANFCRCQNGSLTRAYTVQPAPGGGHALVTLFQGDYVFDLTIIREDGRLVVDDQSCAGRPNTSIYTDPVGPC